MNQPIASTWAEAWRDRSFRIHAILTVPFLVAVLIGLSRLLPFVEGRPGIVLDDPFLRQFSPMNLTWLTFGLIYLGLVSALWSLTHHPRALLVALQSYAIMGVLRILMMYSVPLDPPTRLVPLADPFVQLFGLGTVPTKDLFFSGHTATLFLLFLTAQSRPLKVLFLTCTTVVAMAVLWQHVHYTIDVLVAPFVAYGAYHSVRRLHRGDAATLTSPGPSVTERHR